jgi:2'-5' RNA ligase
MAQPPRALLDLQDRLLGVYRYCSNQERKTPAGFVPHLTIGQFKSLVRASKLFSFGSTPNHNHERMKRWR